jgi:hypothetical protein
MIEFIKSNKLLVATLLLIMCGLVLYKVFFLSNDSTPVLTSTTEEGDIASSPASQNLLAVLSSLRTVPLDNTIFSDPTFVSLTDFGVEIPPEPAGRDNPFAPYVGISPSLSASSTSSALLKLPLGPAQ